MGFWDDKKPKPEKFASGEDIKKLQRDIEKLLKDKDQPDTKGATSRLVKNLAHGFGDIAESLAHPESKRRMRIAQMPVRPPITTYNRTNPISGKNAGIKRRRISYAPKVED